MQSNIDVFFPIFSRDLYLLTYRFELLKYKFDWKQIVLKTFLMTRNDAFISYGIWNHNDLGQPFLCLLTSV